MRSMFHGSAVVLAVARFANIPRPANSFALIAGLLVIAAVCVYTVARIVLAILRA